MRVAALTMLVLAVLVLRHDYWNWNTPGHLLFGVLPVGIWWQVGVTLLAAAMMWLMVKFAWPGHLEDDADQAKGDRS